jgi:hypothetical protein
MDSYDEIIGEELDEAYYDEKGYHPDTFSKKHDTLPKNRSSYRLYSHEPTKKKKIIKKTELDEANQAAKAKLALSNKRMKGSMRPQIKRAGDLAREKRERNAAMRGAKREMKDTGEKVKFQKFKRWDSVKKSAREKMED